MHCLSTSIDISTRARRLRMDAAKLREFASKLFKRKLKSVDDLAEHEGQKLRTELDRLIDGRGAKGATAA